MKTRAEARSNAYGESSIIVPVYTRVTGGGWTDLQLRFSFRQTALGRYHELRGNAIEIDVTVPVRTPAPRNRRCCVGLIEMVPRAARRKICVGLKEMVPRVARRNSYVYLSRMIAAKPHFLDCAFGSTWILNLSAHDDR